VKKIIPCISTLYAYTLEKGFQKEHHLTNHDIILIAAEPWEGSTWRRRHHVAWSLAKDNRVLFIEPPVPKTAKRISVKHQGRNLYSITIKKRFPDRIIRNKISLSWINERLIRRELKKTAKEMGIKSPLLWVYFWLQQYDYFNLFDERLIISDWHDMFGVYCGWTSDKYEKDILIGTKKIIKKADTIFAVSKEIYEYLKKKRDDVYFLPHGVAQEIFDLKINDIPDIERLKSLKDPKIGYLGAMQYLVDFELLNYLAKNRKDWKIVLAGEEHINNFEDRNAFMQLLKNDNVIYLGEIAKEQIPNFLEALDVCMMPFKKVEWMKYVSAPLKLWEYMASGKPIVAVDRGAEYECNNYIKTARTSDEFIELVEDVLKNGESQFVIEERKHIAKNNSWDKRVKQMMEIIEERLRNNGR